MTSPEQDARIAAPFIPARTDSRPRRLGGRRPSTLWSIRREIPMPLAVGLGIAFPALLFVAWIVAIEANLVRDIFLPSPAEVVRAGGGLLESGQLASDAWASFRRVSIGFGLAMAVSIPLGLGIGSFRSVSAFFEPVIGFVRYMPALVFIPLLIIWLGIFEEPKIALIFIGTLFFNTLMIANIVWQVPGELIRVAYTLGGGSFTVFRKVIFPYALPGIIDAARVNLAAAWNLLLVAELFAADEGLGVRIVRAQRFLDTDRIFFILIVIGVIGLTSDIALRMLRNRLAPWSQE